jgi:site-specific DNA-methyltransferase (adenine-specific)
VTHLLKLASGHPYKQIGSSMLVHADCIEWMNSIPESSIHGIVTDPPYGVKEYEFEQIKKRSDGSGGVWRIPPSFDGNIRSPLPRFTALNDKERKILHAFFVQWSRAAVHSLCPGGHVFIACNSFLCQLVYEALVKGGLEFRGQLIRVVRTLRGGDRPKGAEDEFSDVCSLPRGSYEPWGIFRKPLPDGMTVSECLRTFQTGGLRRLPDGLPFSDLIYSSRTPQNERRIANHPSLKPQSLLRELVYSVLPLGKGIILDPFMGSGSTVAAAQARNISAIGVEKNSEYFDLAVKSIPALATVPVEGDQSELLFVG